MLTASPGPAPVPSCIHGTQDTVPFAEGGAGH